MIMTQSHVQVQSSQVIVLGIKETEVQYHILRFTQAGSFIQYIKLKNKKTWVLNYTYKQMTLKTDTL